MLLYLLWEPALVLGPVAVLLFPDGRLPSARWRWALGAYLAVGLVLLAILVFKSADAIAHHQTRVDGSGQLVVFDQTSGYGGVLFILVAYVMLLAVWLGAMARQILAWRRSYGDRREQFKWLASGAVACFASLLVSVLLSSAHGWWHAVGDVAVIGAAALPVSIGVAILKYRLYDIDRIISRTLAYAIVTGLLIGLYAGLVLLATRVWSFHTPVAVAASTLAAAALFNPLRRRVQQVVDRRFNRARYDADQTVAAFAARLKDAVDLDTVQDDLASVVQHALEPAHVSVWVSQRDHSQWSKSAVPPTQVSPGLYASSGSARRIWPGVPEFAGQLHDVGPDQQLADGGSRDALAERPVIQVDASREPVFLSGQVAGDDDAPVAAPGVVVPRVVVPGTRRVRGGHPERPSGRCA